MHLLVTGAQGQVVQALVERGNGSAAVKVSTLGRPAFDLSNAQAAYMAVCHAIDSLHPDVVVSAAAYTSVDQAEDEPDLAMAINGAGAGAVAQAAARAGLPVIHLSTDYVFDGTKDGPYTEDDPTAPLGIYGRSKRAGEETVAAANACHVIIRTAWVYSPFGKNFVKTMLRVGADRDELTVVGDQLGNPTSAHNIADGVVAAAQSLLGDRRAALAGTYHLAGTGETHWADFARHIFAVSRERDGPFAQVVTIKTADYPTKAARPANSRLDCSRFADAFGYRSSAWEEATEMVVARLLHR